MNTKEMLWMGLTVLIALFVWSFVGPLVAIKKA